MSDNAENFCYWLQGFVELSGDAMISPKQWKQIKDTLQNVFTKMTPNVVTESVGLADDLSLKEGLKKGLEQKLEEMVAELHKTRKTADQALRSSRYGTKIC